jgi:hypothetical protein
MPHFIGLFFEQHGSEYTFLMYEQILNDFYENRLSPVIANAIASIACKYVSFICVIVFPLLMCPPLPLDTLMYPSSQFAAFTTYRKHTPRLQGWVIFLGALTFRGPDFPWQNLAASLSHIATMETLHAVMLIAWAEYKHGRYTGERHLWALSPHSRVLTRSV